MGECSYPHHKLEDARCADCGASRDAAVANYIAALEADLARVTAQYEHRGRRIAEINSSWEAKLIEASEQVEAELTQVRQDLARVTAERDDKQAVIEQYRKLNAHRLELAEQAAREREQAEAQVATLVVALGNDGPWPTPNVLEKLAEAGEHLMKDHDCDAHGWELINGCIGRARQQATAIREALANLPAEVARLLQAERVAEALDQAYPAAFPRDGLEGATLQELTLYRAAKEQATAPAEVGEQ